MPIKNRKSGPMEISCVLNIVFTQPPNETVEKTKLEVFYSASLFY